VCLGHVLPPFIFAKLYPIDKETLDEAKLASVHGRKARIRRAQGHFIKPWLAKGTFYRFCGCFSAILPDFKFNIHIPVMATISFAKTVKACRILPIEGEKVEHRYSK